MLNIGEFARLGNISPRMLRHYDHLGLLHPERVDPQTGYRSYAVPQLARLHRLLALKDLGFGLDQIKEMIDDEPSVEELRGMLRLRRAQIQSSLDDEQARLRRVEAHLRALERKDEMPTQDVVVKMTQPMRVAETTGIAAGFGHEQIGPMFMKLVPKVLGHLERFGAKPGIMLGYYDMPADDGSVGIHVGFDVGDQTLEGADPVEIIDLPVVEVASVVYQGDMAHVEPVYESLIRWIDDSGFSLASASRELYLELDEKDPSATVTELQMPVSK